MNHKHIKGELITEFYVGMVNRDQTEGRGPMVDKRAFSDPDSAYKSIKGQGVMGCGDGDVSHRTYYRCVDCPGLIVEAQTIYMGSSYTQKNTLGKGHYKDFMPDGWHRDYSAFAQDPEYSEYLRLKEKFES